jgi:hypothetical protein
MLVSGAPDGTNTEIGIAAIVIQTGTTGMKAQTGIAVTEAKTGIKVQTGTAVGEARTTG